MSLTLTWIILAFSTCLSVSSNSNDKKESCLPPSTIHLLSCSIPVYMYSGFRIVILYAHGKQL